MMLPMRSNEFADAMQAYTDAGGNPCAGVSLIFGTTATIVGIVFLGVGYHAHNTYISGRDPLVDFNYLGQACQLHNIQYQTHEIEERRQLELISKGQPSYSISQQRERMLPPNTPKPRCYETWHMSFEVANIGNYTESYERRVCGKVCDKCKGGDFWRENTDKVIEGVHLQPGNIVECWEQSSSYIDLAFWGSAYKIRDPSIIFNESKEYQRSQRDIVIGWILFGCGLFLCLLGCGIESVPECGIKQYTKMSPSDAITINMGEPIIKDESMSTTFTILLELARTNNSNKWEAIMVNMGSPHAIVFVDDLENDVDFKNDCSVVEKYTSAIPAETSIVFVQVMGPVHLKMKGWEHGENTHGLACSAGSCASVVAAIHLGMIPRRPGKEGIRITVQDGDLFVEWRESNNQVYLTGPATLVLDKAQERFQMRLP